MLPNRVNILTRHAMINYAGMSVKRSIWKMRDYRGIRVSATGRGIELLPDYLVPPTTRSFLWLERKSTNSASGRGMLK